jgi:hypothetical protein
VPRERKAVPDLLGVQQQRVQNVAFRITDDIQGLPSVKQERYA